MKKELIIIWFGLLSCMLSAQDYRDNIADRARAKEKELLAEGWKVHAGAPSMFEQLYSAYAFETYNDSDNPLQRLYTGVSISEYNCVLMMQEYAKLDLLDWFIDFKQSFSKDKIGLNELLIEGQITYPESRFYFLYVTKVYETNDTVTIDLEISIDSIGGALPYSYQKVIIPFVRLHRRIEDSREEMVIATFKDEFLANRRIPIPVFDNYGDCKSISEEEFKETILYKKKSLHYEETSLDERTLSNTHYEFREAYRGTLSENRIKMKVYAEWILNE